MDSRPEEKTDHYIRQPEDEEVKFDQSRLDESHMTQEKIDGGVSLKIGLDLFHQYVEDNFLKADKKFVLMTFEKDTLIDQVITNPVKI